MYTAYALRAPGQKGIKMKDMGSFTGQLILRSFDRAERVYQAMKCRGFHGVYYGKKRSGLRASEGIAGLLLVVSMVFMRFYNVGLLIGHLVG